MSLSSRASSGKPKRQQVMQLVDQPGALADHGLQPPGDLPQDPQRRRQRGRRRALAECEAAAARASMASDFPIPEGCSYWVVVSGVQGGGLAGGANHELWRWDGERAEFIEVYCIDTY